MRAARFVMVRGAIGVAAPAYSYRVTDEPEDTALEEASEDGSGCAVITPVSAASGGLGSLLLLAVRRRAEG